MTEVDIYEPPVNGEVASRDIVDGWSKVLVQYTQLAAEVCDTEFVPKGMRGKPATVVACWMTGRELGIGPMTSLKHVQLVDGTATLSAEYKRARILAAGHQFEVLEHSTVKCTIRARRRGSNWTEPLTYTIQMATTAKLVKPGGAWITRPRKMLFARVTSEMADMLFPDLTMGLPTTELAEDGDYRDGEFVGQEIAADMPSAASGTAEANGTAPVQRRTRRTKAQMAADKAKPPELTDEEEEGSALHDQQEEDLLSEPTPGAEVEPAVAEGEIVDEDDFLAGDGGDEVATGTGLAGSMQLRRIEVLFGEIGVSEKDRLAAGSIALGRKLAKYAGLTADEAGIMIDILTAAAKAAESKATLRRLVTARRDERMAAEADPEDEKTPF
jgi:hypothetical protein